MKALKITSRVFAVLAVFFVSIAILVAAVTSLIYKLKIKALLKDASTIGVIINAEKEG